jgi:hypothetical protein
VRGSWYKLRGLGSPLGALGPEYAANVLILNQFALFWGLKQLCCLHVITCGTIYKFMTFTQLVKLIDVYFNLFMCNI